jgi:hypothetical protein
MHPLENVLEGQITLNKGKNLLYERLGEVIEIDPTFLAVLEELLGKERDDLTEPALENAVSFAAEALIKRLYSVNQFLQVDDRNRRKLMKIYRRTWNKIIETKNIHATLKAYHYPALTRWISGLYPHVFVERLKLSPAIGKVVCEEYSPGFQIELLRINLQTCKPPLLDIGCGSTAGLVRTLRKLQIDAYGFDRRIEQEAAFLQQRDWFSYCFEPGVWGTILSNMAFTNHFQYVYAYDRSKFGQYTQKYHEIIESLMIGGSFHYAPSVPWIEQQLNPDQYQVERFVVIKDIWMTKVTKIAA